MAMDRRLLPGHHPGSGDQRVAVTCPPGHAIVEPSGKHTIRDQPMGADYYSADTENGDHVDDPSEDGLFMLLEDLRLDGNSFVTITPARAGPPPGTPRSPPPQWHLRSRTRHPARGEHHRDTATTPVARCSAHGRWWRPRHESDDLE
jgi:hypothetical protein